MYGLVRDLTIAGHLVKCAARFGLKARNFDHAGAFMASVRELRPFLAVLDFDNLGSKPIKRSTRCAEMPILEVCRSSDL